MFIFGEVWARPTGSSVFVSADILRRSPRKNVYIYYQNDVYWIKVFEKCLIKFENNIADRKECKIQRCLCSKNQTTGCETPNQNQIHV